MLRRLLKDSHCRHDNLHSLSIDSQDNRGSAKLHNYLFLLQFVIKTVYLARYTHLFCKSLSNFYGK